MTAKLSSYDRSLRVAARAYSRWACDPVGCSKLAARAEHHLEVMRHWEDPPLNETCACSGCMHWEPELGIHRLETLRN